MTIALIRQPEPNKLIVVTARLHAATGISDGRGSSADMAYIQNCWHYDAASETAIIFTRESGYHSGGWWKNPDYERCFHLSLRMLTYERGKPLSLPFNSKLAAKWVRAFFGEDASLVWHEPPFTETGKREQVHHYRLFCDEAWKPFKPRGEVYSKRWTPSHWQSFSDVEAAQS